MSSIIEIIVGAIILFFNIALCWLVSLLGGGVGVFILGILIGCALILLGIISFIIQNRRQINTDISTDKNLPNAEEVLHKFNPGIIARNIDGIPLAYRYHDTKITVTDEKVLDDIFTSGTFELSADEQNGKILLFWNNINYAILDNGKRANMLSDWMKSGEPYKIYANSKSTVYLALYRDMRAKLAHHEQSIVKLTSYSSEDKQITISCLDNTDRLTLAEDIDDNGNEVVYVEADGEVIGRLPKAAAKRYIEEGASACFFEKDDYDGEKDKYIPYITIYW